MWVPTLAGTPSGEVGHPAYQHPQRLREGAYGPEVDRFPLLVIYLAIRALSLGGRQLWDATITGTIYSSASRTLSAGPVAAVRGVATDERSGSARTRGKAD